MAYKAIPGLMIALVTRDSVIFSGGFGYADLEEKIPVNSTHLFRLGSITKSFAALAIFKLVREGKLSLDDKVSDIAPEISIQNLKYEIPDPEIRKY
jgi:CubicO group peptidase (beta-lactamase class C family)